MLLLWLWTYTGPLVTPTPACRTCVIEAESRTYVIAAENRTHVVRC
jgi:hypothetical protein